MSPGFYKFLADALVVFHFTFVGFVLLGGAIVLRWRRAMWFHLPAVAWGIFIELSHGICPLTPLENQLRLWGRGSVYQGSFVDHYVMRVLYPDGLTKNMQVAIACVIVGLNAAAYGWMIAAAIHRRHKAKARGFMVTAGAGDAEGAGATGTSEPGLTAGAASRGVETAVETVVEVR